MAHLDTRVWGRNASDHDRVVDERILRILWLLDPVNGETCGKCAAPKTAGKILCDSCNTSCPDPDCRVSRRNGRQAMKSASGEMCQDCLRWALRLDMPCRGYPPGCDDSDCQERRDRDRRSPVFSNHEEDDCYGERMERHGFFVYQLDTGYIGMTYNPSKRQVEHRARQYVAKQEKARGAENRIDHPQAYIAKVVSEDWPKEYAKHWEGVRKSDKRYAEERRIRWLSPPLGSREMAFRCEWALKSYHQQADSLLPGRFEEITSLSSVPLIDLRAFELRYDADAQVAFFELAWRLSNDLGPSQIVPVHHYELECLDDDSGDFVPANLDISPGVRDDDLVSYSYDATLGLKSAWRVRAVNDVGIPGPWSGIHISTSDMESAIQDFIRVDNVSCSLQGKASGMVYIAWDTDNDIPGLTFDVERQSGDAATVVATGLVAHSLTDWVQPQGVTRYQYRVRANLFGVSGRWIDGWRSAAVIVGGPRPGEVGRAEIVCDSPGTIELQWSRPEWEGYSNVTDYEVARWNDGWVPVGSVRVDAPTVPFRHANPSREVIRWNYDWSFVDRGLPPLGYTYGVRALNESGAGPWREVSVAAEDMLASLERGLQIDQLFCQLRDPVEGLLELSWRVPDCGLDAAFEVERRSGNDVSRQSGTGSSYIDRFDLAVGNLYRYRVRISLWDVEGEWSDTLGVLIVDGFESLKKVPSEEFLAAHGIGPLFAVDINGVGRGAVVALTYRRARGMKSIWDFGKTLHQAEIDVLGKIIERNKGGLVVEWCGTRGFLPNSLAVGSAGELEGRVGQYTRLRIKEVRTSVRSIRRYKFEHNEFVFDERTAAQRANRFTKTKLALNYYVGQIVPGTIRSIKDFGVFVNLGHVDGLVHISELAWEQVASSENVVNVGDVVNVKVIKVDRVTGKIGLSLKQAQGDPWASASERYRIGDMVEGRIVSLAPFGAFVRLNCGLQGLIHVSEMSSGRVNSPSDVVGMGDLVQVEVLRVEPERKRIGLRLR